MARRSLEQDLDRIRSLRDEPHSEARHGEMNTFLSKGASHAVAAVATTIAEQEIRGLGEALRRAFDRFMTSPVKRDPGCKAKAALVRALQVTEPLASDVFLRGIAHIQMEPSWGPPVDTATELRSRSAFALVESNEPDAILHLVELLTDKETPCRAAAAQAIAVAPNSQAASAVLRLKIRIGDPEPEVLGQCMDGLLGFGEDSGVDFVVGLLNGSDALLTESAALALGASRTSAAFAALRRWWNLTVDPNLRSMGLIAIGLIRDEDSRQFLLDLVRSGHSTDALAALEGLQVYAHDAEICEQVRDAAAANPSRNVLARASQLFED